MSIAVPGLALLFAVAFSFPEGAENAFSQEKNRAIIGRLERSRNYAAIDREDTLWSEVGKCGFRISFDAVGIWGSLNREEQSLVAEYLQPAQMQKDTIIGQFRLHYDTSGIDEPALLDSNNQRIPGSARAFVDSVGYYFNHVWNYELDTLGYTAPPMGAGDLYYNVYVENLGSSLYGETRFSPNPINPGQTPPRYTTYIRIHNDFQPFYSKGIEALKVTAAHELHHAVQVGAYGYWWNDIYFYEITSTWLEDVLYNDVNDYYQYIRTTSGAPRGHFDTPHRSLNVANGSVEYSRAIWGKFVEKRFDRSLMRQTWELMRQQTSLGAMDAAFNARGSNLREAYQEFALWNYFTGNRADSVNYYTEGANYPEVRFRDSLVFQAPLSVFSSQPGVESLGSTYYLLFFNAQQSVATSPIIVKHNIAEAGNGNPESFQYVIRSDGGDDSYLRLPVDNALYWAKLSGVNNPTDWSLTHPGVKIITSSVVVYPNPFYPRAHGWVRFEIPDDRATKGTLYIFTSSMELTYSKDDLNPSTGLRSPFFTWYGKSNLGGEREASSGVYFYIADVEGREYTGKFVLLRK